MVSCSFPILHMPRRFIFGHCCRSDLSGTVFLSWGVSQANVSAGLTWFDSMKRKQNTAH